MNNFHISWAINFLNEHGYLLHASTPVTVQSNPWSEVYRFATNKGFVFLKITPPALALEPTIINILCKEFNASVPCIIAENKELHCFLMQDAGIRLHDYFKEKFHGDVFIQAMQDYAALQIRASDRIELFLEMGVPDWRLEKLPKLYQDLYVENEWLLIDDGLNSDELLKLKELESRFIVICEKLSRYQIKETFGHADFHDKNILVNPHTNQTTLIDLGEVVITHPFFSIHNCLHMANENFSLSVSQYKQIQLACLKPWLELEKEENLFEIMDIIQQCWSIHAVLGELRLMHSVDQLAFQALRRQGRLARKMRYWINCNNVSSIL